MRLYNVLCETRKRKIFRDARADIVDRQAILING